MEILLAGVVIFAPLLTMLVLVCRAAFGWRAAFGLVGTAVALTALLVLWVFGVLHFFAID